MGLRNRSDHHVVTICGVRKAWRRDAPTLVLARVRVSTRTRPSALACCLRCWPALALFPPSSLPIACLSISRCLPVACRLPVASRSPRCRVAGPWLSLGCRLAFPDARLLLTCVHQTTKNNQAYLGYGLQTPRAKEKNDGVRRERMILKRPKADGPAHAFSLKEL